MLVNSRVLYFTFLLRTFMNNYFRSIRSALPLATLAVGLLHITDGYSSPSAVGQATHTIELPAQVFKGQPFDVTWRTKDDYANVDYTYFWLGHRQANPNQPNGPWERTLLGGSTDPTKGYVTVPGGFQYRETLDEVGIRCFTVRSGFSGGLGSYVPEVCTTVLDSVPSVAGVQTHKIDAHSVGPVAVNQPITLRWEPSNAFQNVPFSVVRVSAVRPNGTSTYWDYVPPNRIGSGVHSFAPNMAGNWCFYIRGYRGNHFSQSPAANCVFVGEAAKLDVGEENHQLDPLLSSKRTLTWDVTGANSSKFEGVVAHRGKRTAKAITPVTGNGRRFITFSLDDLGLTQYLSDEKAVIYLRGCQVNGNCANIAAPLKVNLLNTRELAYFEGTPTHFPQFFIEMPYPSEGLNNFIANKLWKQSSEADITYDLELLDVFKSYLYQYDLDSRVLDTKKPLFDAFLFHNNRFKEMSGGAACFRMDHTFTAGKVKRLKSDKKECARNYLDLIFGTKADSNRLYFSNERKPLLEVLHEAAEEGGEQVGFYVAFPSGFATKPEAEARRKAFVDEVIEQYALFRKNNEGTLVKLAGFFTMNESSDKFNSDRDDVIANVRQHIKQYSDELELNASSYNSLKSYNTFKVGDNSSAFKTFKQTCSQANKVDCLTRFTGIDNPDLLKHFDYVVIQSNATKWRFQNRQMSYKVNGSDKRLDFGTCPPNCEKREDGTGYKVTPVDPVDIEMIKWMTDGLLGPLTTANFGGPQFGLHFEHSRHMDSNKHLFPAKSLQPEGGAYGDITRYADYIMTEAPVVYRNSTRPTVYDDHGGLFYCHVKHAVNDNIASSRQCRSGIGSVSEVKALYQFINATRNSTVAYQGTNNLLPREPLLKVAPGTTRISDKKDVGTYGQLTVQAMVRARLKDDMLHRRTGFEGCPVQPVVMVDFYNSNGVLISSKSIDKPNQQPIITPLNCRNFKSVADGIREDLDNGRYFTPDDFGARSSLSLNLDIEQWELLNNTVSIPSETEYFKVRFTSQGTNSGEVDSFLYHRPEFKLE